MKEVARNKRAYFDYEILERFEAGISLLGQEVKSVKSGRINLAGSYAILRGNEVWLVGADIPPYQPQNAPEDYDPQRTRKLLLTEKEIKTLTGEIKGTGLTLVPLRAYIKGRLIKLELGLARGKKKADKREVIKKRETEREIRRTLRK
ncbi:MAG: SsrA-binding protein SmpB [Candidatus Colwellbacteria bacterium]|nr:SsrA-binding protein SmpB [Candidatus Colwellbacteria bacterium]